jgi:hypothetical protein
MNKYLRFMTDKKFRFRILAERGYYDVLSNERLLKNS